MSGRKAKLRFAFDLGTNSIGWAVYKLEHGPAAPSVEQLVDCGVRLFDDGRNPKDGRSLAEMRRVPRAARRRRDRYVLRRRELIAALVHYGLLPQAETDRGKLAALDPYALRVRGLDHALSPYDIGRALLHLNRRRGFKSNRKTDRKGQEKGKIAEAAKRLRERLSAEGARTFGEYLWRRHGGLDGAATPRTRKPVRIRLEGEGSKALYDIYPTREMLEHEFDQLIAAQYAHYPGLLSPETIASLRYVIFRQRPLKPVPVGRCTLEPTEPRLPKAMPSVEARVIYDVLNHLRYGEGLRPDKRLDRTQRDLLAASLLQGKGLSFDKLRTMLKLPASIRFSLELGGKTDLKDFASKSAAAIAKKERFGPHWLTLSLPEQDAIVGRLIKEEDDDALMAWLQGCHGLDGVASLAVAGWMPPYGTSRLGATANAAVLAELCADHLCTYSDAVRRAGEKLDRPWHHSDFRDGEIQIPLPYYGRVLERHVSFGTGNRDDEPEQRYGRLPNPTVHIGLGQLRRILNRLVVACGEPSQIVVELARDLKLSRKQKEEEQLRNRENRKANDLRRQALDKLGQPDTGENRLRLRLFEEQQRANGGVALCPYSCKPIGIEKLFSSEVDIDHILPYSRTLDDTSANCLICYRTVNRVKRSKSPFEAFGTTPEWPRIVAVAAGLPRNKGWRFASDAMERFERKERDFLTRQINETRHLSRLAQSYLGAACGPDNVYVTTGQLTAMLRARWGLNAILGDENRKVRSDHRHHAIDAVVVGAIDRSLLQEMARRARIAELEDRHDITRDVPEPFSGFRDAVREKVRAITVSVKPEHGKTGALHEDTAYGLVSNEAEVAEIGNLVYRKPLVDLNTNEIDHVRDPTLRRALQEVAGSNLADPKALKAALATFAQTRAVGRISGIRRVRLGKKETSAVHIRDRRTGSVYKALIPGDNHHIDIVQMRDGSWSGFDATVFEVNQRDWSPRWEREKLGGKLVMRLHKGDMVEVSHNGSRQIMIVHRLEAGNNRVRLAAHFEGGQLDRRRKSDEFEWLCAAYSQLKVRAARKVHVDEIGCVRPAKTNV